MPLTPIFAPKLHFCSIFVVLSFILGSFAGELLPSERVLLLLFLFFCAAKFFLRRGGILFRARLGGGAERLPFFRAQLPAHGLFQLAGDEKKDYPPNYLRDRHGERQRSHDERHDVEQPGIAARAHDDGGGSGERQDLGHDFLCYFERLLSRLISLLLLFRCPCRQKYGIDDYLRRQKYGDDDVRRRPAVAVYLKGVKSDIKEKGKQAVNDGKSEKYLGRPALFLDVFALCRLLCHVYLKSKRPRARQTLRRSRRKKKRAARSLRRLDNFSQKRSSPALSPKESANATALPFFFTFLPSLPPKAS